MELDKYLGADEVNITSRITAFSDYKTDEDRVSSFSTLFYINMVFKLLQFQQNINPFVLYLD